MVLQLNIMVWWIHRSYGWKYDWAYQVVGLAGLLFLGWAAHEVSILLIETISSGLFFAVGVAFVFYVIMVLIMIWAVPWVAGLQREEFLWHLKNPLKLFRH